MTANVLTCDYGKMIGISMLVGWVDCMLGLAVSYQLNVPSGAAIILVSIIVYTLTKIIKKLTERCTFAE